LKQDLSLTRGKEGKKKKKKKRRASKFGLKLAALSEANSRCAAFGRRKVQVGGEGRGEEEEARFLPALFPPYRLNRALITVQKKEGKEREGGGKGRPWHHTSRPSPSYATNSAVPPKGEGGEKKKIIFSRGVFIFFLRPFSLNRRFPPDTVREGEKREEREKMTAAALSDAFHPHFRQRTAQPQQERGEGGRKEKAIES